MENHEWELYRLKVNKLAHFELLLAGAHTVFLTAIYFILRGQIISEFHLLAGAFVVILLGVVCMALNSIVGLQLIDIGQIESQHKIQNILWDGQQFVKRFKNPSTAKKVANCIFAMPYMLMSVVMVALPTKTSLSSGLKVFIVILVLLIIVITFFRWFKEPMTKIPQELEQMLDNYNAKMDK